MPPLDHFVPCVCISSVMDSDVGKRCGGISVCTRSLECVIATLLEEVLEGLYSQAGVHWTRQECI